MLKIDSLGHFVGGGRDPLLQSRPRRIEEACGPSDPLLCWRLRPQTPQNMSPPGHDTLDENSWDLILSRRFSCHCFS